MQTETIKITVEAVLPTQQYGHLHLTIERFAHIDASIGPEVTADLLAETREIVIAEVLKHQAANPSAWLLQEDES